MSDHHQPKPAPTREGFFETLTPSMGNLLIHIYNSGYMAGHHDTVESTFADLTSACYGTENEDVVTELVNELRPEGGSTTYADAKEAEVRALRDALREMEIRALEAELKEAEDDLNYDLQLSFEGRVPRTVDERAESDALLPRRNAIRDRLAQLRADAGEGGR